MPSLLHQHSLGQETVEPQRSIRIEVFATNRAAYRRVRRADSRGAPRSYYLVRIAVPRFSAFPQFLALEGPDRQGANAIRHPAVPGLLDCFASFQLSKRMADRSEG
jgi:hypothetical protein